MTLIYSFRDTSITAFVRLWKSNEFISEDYISFSREKLFRRLNILKVDLNTPAGPAVFVEIMEKSSDGNNFFSHTGWIPLFNQPIEIVDTEKEYLLFDGRFNSHVG